MIGAVIKLRTVPDPPASDPYAALARSAARGDTAAIRTLVAAIAPAVLRGARGVLGSAHPDLEDIAQESAISFVRALPGFRGDCTVLHFASRIAVFTAISAKRKSGSRGGRSEHIGIDEQAAIDSSPADAMMTARRCALVRELCATLPEAQSEALVMHCMLGFTIEEVSSASGVPINTVRSRLRLAKDALRARIEADPRLRDEVGEEP
jgi:RNA polymerase sigma factor (sigma-70 family)